MRQLFLMVLILVSAGMSAQELYVYSEPASNMPAHSVSARMTGNFVPKNGTAANRFQQRYTPEVMFGLSKKWMLHVAVPFADMHTRNVQWEGISTYLKYRFISVDDVHQHFRMAAFLEGSYTRSPFEYDETTLQGDKSGIGAGIIATQLVNKLAVSATITHLQVLDGSRNNKVFYSPARNYQAMNYSLSAGYLLLPVNYTSYGQTNVNLYVELLAQQALDAGTSYWDAAPALQFIFNSNAKLNIGYRFQIAGDMLRMNRRSILVSFERTFLNALKHNRGVAR